MMDGAEEKESQERRGRGGGERGRGSEERALGRGRWGTRETERRGRREI